MSPCSRPSTFAEVRLPEQPPVDRPRARSIGAGRSARRYRCRDGSGHSACGRSFSRLPNPPATHSRRWLRLSPGRGCSAPCIGWTEPGQPPTQSVAPPARPWRGSATTAAGGRDRGAGCREALLRASATRVRRLTHAPSGEAELAYYLESWRRKVERIGNINYPGEARARGLERHPAPARRHRTRRCAQGGSRAGIERTRGPGRGRGANRASWRPRSRPSPPACGTRSTGWKSNAPGGSAAIS